MTVAVVSGGSFGLGLLVLGVGFLMALGAALTLRSIWGRPTAQERADGEAGVPYRSAQVGEMRTRFRLLISFDFGCLAITAAVLLFIGFAIISRAL